MWWWRFWVLVVGLLVGRGLEGQDIGEFPEVWVDLTPSRRFSLHEGRPVTDWHASLSWHITQRWRIRADVEIWDDAWIMYMDDGYPMLPQVDWLKKGRGGSVTSGYMVRRIWRGLFYVEGGTVLRWERGYANVNDHVTFPFILDRIVAYNYLFEWLLSVGVTYDYPISSRVWVGWYLDAAFPVMYRREGEELFVRRGRVVYYREFDEGGLANFSPDVSSGVYLRVGLGMAGGRPLSAYEGGRGYPAVSLWRGSHLEFFRRHAVYDAPPGLNPPLLHARMYYDQRLFDEVLGSFWRGYPRGGSWGVRLGWPRFSLNYGRYVRRWYYWRDWDPSNPLVIVRYHGDVVVHRLEGGYWLRGGSVWDVLVRVGGVFRGGELSRVIDTALTPPETAEWALSDLGEFGVGGGVRLEVRPLWFGYVYADGGVSHMLWGRMVDYHRTTWTLGVGAGVRIPLGDGKEGEGL